MNTKKELIDSLQSLIAVRILCSIALSLTFLLGPLATVAWFYFLLSEPEVAWAAPPELLNIACLIGFVVLVWLSRLLDKKIEMNKSKLVE